MARLTRLPRYMRDHEIQLELNRMRAKELRQGGMLTAKHDQQYVIALITEANRRKTA